MTTVPLAIPALMKAAACLSEPNGRDRIAAALADGDLALAVLVAGNAAVNAILLRLAGFTLPK
ncbi:hypothetical protein [Bradyrhizobium elkanii]|uniref:hypothetical protein n=1 Tax=Bradyrhizobium elkanii TaxID=29448 RepID=UPI000570DE20|nr:hypothetical protein [Bradyrhizobium elkanii]